MQRAQNPPEYKLFFHQYMPQSKYVQLSNLTELDTLPDSLPSYGNNLERRITGTNINVTGVLVLRQQSI
jgi:hypothetical protein